MYIYEVIYIQNRSVITTLCSDQWIEFLRQDPTITITSVKVHKYQPLSIV